MQWSRDIVQRAFNDKSAKQTVLSFSGVIIQCSCLYLEAMRANRLSSLSLGWPFSVFPSLECPLDKRGPTHCCVRVCLPTWRQCHWQGFSPLLGWGIPVGPEGPCQYHCDCEEHWEVDLASHPKHGGCEYRTVMARFCLCFCIMNLLLLVVAVFWPVISPSFSCSYTSSCIFLLSLLSPLPPLPFLISFPPLPSLHPFPPPPPSLFRFSWPPMMRISPLSSVILRALTSTSLKHFLKVVLNRKTLS